MELGRIARFFKGFAIAAIDNWRDAVVSDSKYQEFSKKYVRSGRDVIVPKEKNPFKQMKFDTFRLENSPDFGGLGGHVDWGYICDPVNMFPDAAVSESARHLTILGGNPVNYLELHGEVEITLGHNRDDLHVFRFNESVSVYVEKGMFYNINVTKIDGPARPIHYNELVYGDIIPEAAEVAGEDIGEGYRKYLKSGKVLHAVNQPHHEVIYPVIYVGSPMFGAAEPIRRTWMPVSEPHTLANKAHYHKYLEYIVFYGTNPDDPLDLGGIVEFTIGENEDDLTVFTIDKSTQFFVKPGLWHSPMVFSEIRDRNKPIIFCEVSYAPGFGGPDQTVWIDGISPYPPAPPEN